MNILFFILLYLVINKLRKKGIEKFEEENINQINSRELCYKIEEKVKQLENEIGNTQDIINHVKVIEILNRNLSESDRKKINQDCRDSAVSSAVNLVDNMDCKWCVEHAYDIEKRCVMKNIKQTNIAKISQTCSIQSILETLTTKRTIEAQALVEILKNKYNTENKLGYKKEDCSKINPEMTSEKYLDIKSKCSTHLGIQQENSIKYCGTATGIVQENQFKSFQECIIGDAIKEKVMIDDTKKTYLEAGGDDNKIILIFIGLIIFLIILFLLIFTIRKSK